MHSLRLSVPAALRLFLLFLLSLSPVGAPAQQPAPGAGSPAATPAEQIRRAESLLEQADYRAAEPLLAALARSSPKDPHILFDLGFTEEHNGEEDAAATSYAAAVAADPNLPEPHVALGLLNARTGHLAQARQHLQAATALPSTAPALKARALRALARLDQGVHPDQARQELAEAIQLTGEQPDDAALTGNLAAAAGDATDAEPALRAALAQSPGDIGLTVDLASLLQKQNKLPEADALLTPALAAHPADLRLVAQTASLYAAEGRSADALSLLRTLRDANPDAAANPQLSRLYAHLLLLTGDAAGAEPLFRSLAAAQPDDPALLDDLGSALVREQKFEAAQAVFAQAVAQRAAFATEAAWAETAGHLAFAASRNHQPQVVLQALQARATVLPNSAATLFLEATARDTLHQSKEAARAYRAFLAAADGKLPNEEFEARHRLIALEHEH